MIHAAGSNEGNLRGILKTESLFVQANGKCSDVAGSDGFSVFPGNTNALVLKMEPYAKALHASKGLMPEFVNPKFKVGTLLWKKSQRYFHI